jgi:hypothetical protein
MNMVPPLSGFSDFNVKPTSPIALFAALVTRAKSALKARLEPADSDLFSTVCEFAQPAPIQHSKMGKKSVFIPVVSSPRDRTAKFYLVHVPSTALKLESRGLPRAVEALPLDTGGPGHLGDAASRVGDLSQRDQQHPQLVDVLHCRVEVVDGEGGTLKQIPRNGVIM